MPIRKNQTPVTSLVEWETEAPPRNANQWADGRGALEVARAWLEGDSVDLPKELAAALKRHDDFGKVSTWWGEPGANFAIDAVAGESAQFDLAIHAEDAQGAYLSVVVARADQPFGETVGDTLAAAADACVTDPRSSELAGVVRLVTAMLGPRVEGDPPLKDIRYGLLTACTGVLCEAERLGHPRALLLIHEFITDKSADEKLLRNAIDLSRFAKRLSHGAVNSVAAGTICGPFTVPGKPLVSASVALYIGKVSRNLRKNRP